MADRCGSPAEGGVCVLPQGHNIGNLDIPENHQAAPSRIGTHPVDWPDVDMPFGIDEGIKLEVLVLCAGGFETYQSCEGGPGHSFPEPTVQFHGQPSEGLRAVSWAMAYGLHVDELRRVWTMDGAELTGPTWAMTFRHPAAEVRCGRFVEVNLAQGRDDLCDEPMPCRTHKRADDDG